MFSLTLALILASLTAVCYLANRLLSLPQDPREPPPIPESVPFIQHIQGLLRHGSLYYTRISCVAWLLLIVVQSVLTID